VAAGGLVSLARVNPSTALARVLVDEMARGGVRDAVLSPGSRSAPLALALDADDRIRLHVRIDERSAGFLALGLAMVSRRPVPVLCTSGTAAANLHPAVVEASQVGIPLIVLTADRPPELRATGANQAIDQIGLYGDAVRFFTDIGVAEDRPGAVGYWRSLTARALAAAGHATDAGPVHLNVPFREPLVPDGSDDWVEPLDGRADRPLWTQVLVDEPRPRPLEEVLGPIPERGAVVVGHGAVDPAAARLLAETLGWPLLSEPTGNARAGTHAVPTYPLLLGDPDFAAAVRPEAVVVVGKPGLSRSLLGWLAGTGRHVVVDPRLRWADPLRRADVVVPAVPTARPRDATEWLGRWQAADAAARAAVDAVLDGVPEPSEPRLARDLMRGLPAGALLLAGSSRPIRDLEAYSTGREDVTVIGNRGASGIDGLASTTVGAALAHGGPVYALIGDLAFLHDHGGLVLGPGELRPDVTLVIVDNDGGGIFSLLPPAGQQGFERLFGTPHGLDLAAVAGAAGWACTVVDHAADLSDALSGSGSGSGSGPRLVLVRTRREQTAALHQQLQQAVSRAIRGNDLPFGDDHGV